MAQTTSRPCCSGASSTGKEEVRGRLGISSSGARSGQVDGRTRLCLEIVKNLHLGLIALQEGHTNGATTFRVVEVNPAAAQILGMTSEDLVGRFLAECPKLPETGIENHCRQVIRSGKPRVLGEIRYGEEGARSGVYAVTVFPLLNSCICVAFENVTERKRAEEALGWLASFPDRNPNPVIEANSEGVISYVNAAALKRFPDLQLAGAEHATLKSLPQVIAELSSTGKDYLEREVAVGDLIYEQQISFIPEADRVRIYCLDITERKRADAALRASEKALRQLSSRLLQLQDEERRRMARELHDSTGQILTALTMKLGVLRRSVGALDIKTSKALSESLALAEQCSREVRTFSYLLHPPLLDEEGLASALGWYVEGFTGRSGINVELDVAVEFGRLSQELEMTLFRVVQESLTNIHRHSTGRRATIRVVRDEAEVRLEVKDDGRGMDARTLEKVSRGVSTLGVGICGMRERVWQLGGELQIESSPRGTTVTVVLPTLGEHHGSGSHCDSRRS